jgi:3-hydroxyisobutyrate dehydrogenase-like beta-hydroxyacid dehydrogenase
LVAEGTELVVWNRTISKGRVAGCRRGQPGARDDQTPVVLINVSDSSAVHEVLAEVC